LLRAPVPVLGGSDEANIAGAGFNGADLRNICTEAGA
jgi:hypothetical protein